MRAETGGRSARRESTLMLLPGREVRAPVPLPARFVLVGTLRPLLAVTDSLQTVGGNAQLHQEILGGAGAGVAQPQVIFGRAAVVAMAFHHNGGIRKIGEEGLERGG